MTSRPVQRQTTDAEACRLAVAYAVYRERMARFEGEGDSWRHWCGSLALGGGDRLAIRWLVRAEVERT